MEARPTTLRKTLLEVMDSMRSTYRSPRGDALGDVRLCLEIAKSVPTTQVFADETRIRQVCSRPRNDTTQKGYSPAVALQLYDSTSNIL